MTDKEAPDDKEEFGEADLFEAISHETRIRALFALRDEPLGFAQLKRELGISSSGNLQHHIMKLGGLVQTDAAGNYILTDQGREALIAVRTVRNLDGQLEFNLRAMTLIMVFAYYVVQMNVPFILGTVTAMTPITALLGTAVSGVIWYVLWRAAFQVMHKNRALRVPVASLGHSCLLVMDKPRCSVS